MSSRDVWLAAAGVTAVILAIVGLGLLAVLASIWFA